MSGALGFISAAAGTASFVSGAVSKLFGAAGPVTLGTVTFTGIEVPEKIRWGGTQALAKHILPGGTVFLFPMGTQFPPISWGGTFEGFTALIRSRLLYTMLHSAVPVSLAWNDRIYTVVVSDYTADDTQPNWIPYRVTCAVLRDETLSNPPPQLSLLQQIGADLSSAASLLSVVGL